MGVIDVIADGCFAVARRPYLLIPPVALDLFFWLSDRMTIAPLTEALIRVLQEAETANAATIDNLRAVEPNSDLFALLAFSINTLLTAVQPAAVARPWGGGVIDLGHWALVLLAGLGLALAGLLVLALYLTGLAQMVREEPFNPQEIARRTPVCWLRLLGLVATILGGLFLLGMPLLILATVLTALGISTAPLLLFLFLPALLVYCYLALAPEAIAVSEVGPLKALRLSVRVVRPNFWALVRLLAATFLIVYGFPHGWQLVTRQVAGVPLAIAGNAFLATGLATAAMLFYKERLAALEAPASNRVVEQAGNRQ